MWKQLRGAFGRPFFLALLLNGCAILSTPDELLQDAKSLAHSHGFHETIYKTSHFSLLGFEHIQNPKAAHAVVYIEGDGNSWINRYQPSSDPTPRDPVALKLALNDSCPNVIYLSRPCQYILPLNKALCMSDYWTDARYSEPVIQTYKEVLDQLKKTHRFRSFTLVGYSGGGAVAALVAVREPATRQLITVAGNIDPRAWIRLHNLSPLTRSLDPLAYKDALKHIPQIHYVGGQDTVVPLSVAQSYKNTLGNPPTVHIKLIEDASHDEGWDRVKMSEIGCGMSVSPTSMRIPASSAGTTAYFFRSRGL